VAPARMTENKLLAMASLAAVVLTTAAERVQAFQMGVAPMRHEFSLSTKPVTRSIKLLNQGADDMKISLRVAHFDLDKNNNVREIAPTPQSLDQWIILRPLKFTIKAGQTKTIRFAVRPKARPKPGEHRAIILINRSDKPKKTVGKLNIGFRFGVVVYAHVGKVVRRAKLRAVRTAPTGLEFDIQSTGNAHARMIGSYGVWPAAKFPGRTVAAAMISRSEFIKRAGHKPSAAVAANLLPDTPVLPKTRRTVHAKFANSLPPGKYRALVKGRIGARSLTRVISFKVGG
jgi:P pilus assembly chaperone PapD